MKQAVDHRYHQFLDARGDYMALGTVKVHFVVDRDGKVQSSHIVSNSANEALASVALRALAEAQLSPMPAGSGRHLRRRASAHDHQFRPRIKSGSTRSFFSRCSFGHPVEPLRTLFADVSFFIPTARRHTVRHDHPVLPQRRLVHDPVGYLLAGVRDPCAAPFRCPAARERAASGGRA